MTRFSRRAILYAYKREADRLTTVPRKGHSTLTTETVETAPAYAPTAEELAAAENKNIMSLTTVVPLGLFSMVGDEVGVDEDGKPNPTGAWLRNLIAAHFNYTLPAEAAKGRARVTDEEKRRRAQEANAKRQAIIAELKRRKGA